MTIKIESRIFILARRLMLLLKRKKTVSWEELSNHYIKKHSFSLEELLIAMNSILMPCGTVSGDSSFYFWIGPPSAKPEANILRKKAKGESKGSS